MKPRKRSRSLSDDSELLQDEPASDQEVSAGHRFSAPNSGLLLASQSFDGDSRKAPTATQSTSDSSLLPIVAQLQTVWPSLSLGDLLALAGSLSANLPLLQLAARQALAPHSRGADGSVLKNLARILFSRPEHGSFDLDSALGVSPAEQASNERRAILLVAHTLNLIPLDDNDSLNAPTARRLPDLIRSICTHHRVCYQCGGVLQVPKAHLHGVWVLHPSSVERATVVRLRCATKGCGAKHLPDVVKIKQEGTTVQVHNSDADYLRLGRRLYAHRSFAAAYVALLETNHVSASSYAELFNRLYCAPPLFDPTSPPKANKRRLAVRAEHVWRAFVLHSTLELAAETSPPRPFVTLDGSSTEEIVSMALEAYLSEKTIPGAMQHTCPECSRYKRRWKAGAKADQGQFAQRASGKKERVSGCGLCPLVFADYWLSQRLVEDTVIDESRVVKMSAMDGIKIGHAVSGIPSPGM